MSVLEKIEFIHLPQVRMIGKEVAHGAGGNPVPDLWEQCFREGLLRELETNSLALDYYIGWMGDYNELTGQFAYIAGYFLPSNTPVPEGLQYRDLPACMVGLSTVSGSFSAVFSCLHELTVDGLQAAGHTPDYSQGWSAEAYPLDLSFAASEGTVHYLCPVSIDTERSANVQIGEDT